MPAINRTLRRLVGSHHAESSWSDYVELDRKRAMRIAGAYDAAFHNPRHPRVDAAYALFIHETLGQYFRAEARGFVFEPWTAADQPYASSAQMIEDVKRNRHLYFFRGGELPNDHPLAQPSQLLASGVKLNCNDVFRAVHDLFGHAAEGFEFGPRGEENAWRHHARMYSPLARKAMTTETRGQNCWFNCGPHLRRLDGTLPMIGDIDFINPACRPFAPQKAAILPAWCWRM